MIINKTFHPPRQTEIESEHRSVHEARVGGYLCDVMQRSIQRTLKYKYLQLAPVAKSLILPLGEGYQG